MKFLIAKYLFTAAIVVLISEVARRSDKLGAFVGALPLTTLLVLLWLFVEQTPQDKIGNYMWYSFWYVLPTLPMFLLFPFALPRYGFGVTMLLSAGLTFLCFGILALILRYWDIHLF